MPDAYEVIAQLGGIIDSLDAQIEELGREKAEARTAARSLLGALEGCMALEITRHMTAHQAAQVAERVGLLGAVREVIAAWEEPESEAGRR